ncbi:MAG TPA: phosphohistidine phosphatase SixA [Candidatus Methylomirabilis sp.]|nr:phosphohistidine phosphatase SixA [Candidatus Methylomirabilis sp.]
MTLYLVQHGEAMPEAEDPARPLSGRGREQVERVGRHGAAVRLLVAEIRHSGKLRARQTAEILARHLLPARGVREADGMAPDDDPGKAAAAVEAAAEPLMLVGHLPHLGRLASSLLVGDPDREIVRFRNGGIVCLAKAGTGWRLQWILTPELVVEHP